MPLLVKRLKKSALNNHQYLPYMPILRGKMLIIKIFIVPFAKGLLKSGWELCWIFCGNQGSKIAWRLLPGFKPMTLRSPASCHDLLPSLNTDEHQFFHHILLGQMSHENFQFIFSDLGYWWWKNDIFTFNRFWHSLGTKKQVNFDVQISISMFTFYLALSFFLKIGIFPWKSFKISYINKPFK